MCLLDGWDSLWLPMPDIHKSHIWIPDLLKSHKCIPGAHLFPYYKSFSFTPVYHIKQHIHCSFLQVWDYDRNKDDDFLGRCHLDLRFLSTDHNTSFLIIPSRIPKKFYVPVTIAMENRTADGSDWRGWKYFIVWSGGIEDIEHDFLLEKYGTAFLWHMKSFVSII